MITHDLEKYYEAKKKVNELKPLLDELDKITDILYNNLGNSGFWNILNVAEDIRVKYYLEHYEYDQVVKNKGKITYE